MLYDAVSWTNYFVINSLSECSEFCCIQKIIIWLSSSEKILNIMGEHLYVYVYRTGEKSTFYRKSVNFIANIVILLDLMTTVKKFEGLILWLMLFPPGVSGNFNVTFNVAKVRV